jgi:anti-sigma regulatory factor (Ser/Thr protein kinase)
VSTTRTLSGVHPAGYRHEALLWDDADDFLAGIVPFVADGLAAGMPVMVAVHADRWALLRAALGADADRVRHVDTVRLGHNPARLVPAWRRFVALADHGPCRGIAEPITAGMRDAHLTECQVHEAVLNVAIPQSTPLWLLCPYHRALTPPILAEARRSHPVVTSSTESSHIGYAGVEHTRTLTARPLPPPRSQTEYRRFRCGDLARIRHFVADRARTAGIAADRVADLCLAVSEIATNSIDHGGGRGFLRMWQEEDRFVVEVSDAGRIDDPLVGRVDPGIEQDRGRGLWMAHQMCDLLQIRTTPRGSVLRAITWL